MRAVWVQAVLERAGVAQPAATAPVLYPELPPSYFRHLLHPLPRFPNSTLDSFSGRLPPATSLQEPQRLLPLLHRSEAAAVAAEAHVCDAQGLLLRLQGELPLQLMQPPQPLRCGQRLSHRRFERISAGRIQQEQERPLVRGSTSGSWTRPHRHPAQTLPPPPSQSWQGVSVAPHHPREESERQAGERLARRPG